MPSSGTKISAFSDCAEVSELVGRPTKESTSSPDSSLGRGCSLVPACATIFRWPPARPPNHRRYSLLANSSSSLPRGATDTEASSASSTVVKRSCEACSCSRMRVGSVMSVIDVIQPVCWPRASTSGDTYSRASNTLPSLRFTRTWKPPWMVRPLSSSSSRAASSSRSSSGQ